MVPLERFTRAQDAREGGIQTALTELESGRKRSHWIWYVFPQLAGLGHSSTARHYALRDADEAADYLRDPVLRERLLLALRAVAAQLEKGVTVRALMGSEIDALKLVSSLTLFEFVARRLDAIEPTPVFAPIETVATRILDIAGSQGLARCSFTLGRLGQ